MNALKERKKLKVRKKQRHEGMQARKVREHVRHVGT